MNTDTVATTIRSWIDDLVIGEQLCPFARQPVATGRVRFQVSPADNEQDLLMELSEALRELLATPEIETTLLIHPEVLTDFFTYNQFLDAVDDLLRQEGLEGVIQVASFHPDYQFAGTNPEDAENYSNRSPYPMLHLLREESIEAMIRTFPDIDRVPEQNIRRLRQIGTTDLARRLQACFEDSGDSLL